MVFDLSLDEVGPDAPLPTPTLPIAPHYHTPEEECGTAQE
jgi:hypothetical protein